MKLKEWRKSVGRSAESLATQIGCTRQAINRYELGAAPCPAIIKALYEISGGAITPNDCYEWFPQPAALEQAA